MLSYLLIIFHLLSFGAEDKKPEPKPQTKSVAWVANVLRQKQPQQIEGLELLGERLPVILVPNNGDLRPLVEVRLRYLKKGWTLYNANNKKVKRVKGTDNLVVYAFLNSQVSELLLIAKDESGEVKKEIVYIFAPEVQEFEIVDPWSSLNAFFGYANLGYTQSGVGTLAWNGLALGLGYNTKESGSPFDFSAELQMTVFTLGSEPVDANPQYLRGRANVTYRLPWRKQERWRFYGSLGMSYYEISSNGSIFGFSGLIAPEVATKAKYFLGTKSSMIYEFIVTPFENFGLDNSRGVQLRATWQKTLKSQRRQDVGIRYSNTKFIISGQQISMDFFLLTLGYSL